MLTTIKRATIGLLATITMVAATTSAAMAAGPEAHIVVVHILDGSGVTPADQEPDPMSGVTEQVDLTNTTANLYIQVDSYGVSAHGSTGDGSGFGAGPDGVHADQLANGDVATGLRSANTNCQDRAYCHVVLVTYRQPENRAHRIAAKTAADELKADGHKLHAVAIGNRVDSRHLGFNWYLSGQAFSASPGEAPQLLTQIAGYAQLVDYIEVGGGADHNSWTAEQWPTLSYTEKIWLNPLDCDLETQWLWASDATCHDKR